MSALYRARGKLNGVTTFENLPVNVNDPLWTEIRTECHLTLEELIALKNARCPVAQPAPQP
jgi:hypothetical protein